MQVSGAVFVIRTLGGITATARAIGAPPTTVQGWNDRGRIPQDYWDQLIDAAALKGEQIEDRDFRTPHEMPEVAA